MIVDTIQSRFGSFTDNRGVSPVIGVILMVAITVILAAIVGSFVLGIGVSGENPQAGVTADTVVDGGEITDVVLQLNSNNNVESFELQYDGATADGDQLFEDGVGSQETINMDGNQTGGTHTLTVVGDTGDNEGVITTFEFDDDDVQ